MPSLEEAADFIKNNGTLASHLEMATDLVTDYVGGAEIPKSVLDNCILTVAQELQLQQKSPGGYTTFQGAELPSRVRTDPMESVYRKLNKYVIGLA